MIPPPQLDDIGPEQTPPGMAAEHALLGLLSLRAGGSGHGYDLARHFSADAPLGNVIRLEPGMVYHHLKKLERLGWVEPSPDSMGRLSRRSIALSQSGRQELARWLGEPVTHTREIRLEFLVKLYFALLLDARIARRLVAEQREMCSRLIQTLSMRVREGGQDDPSASREHRFGQMVLDMRLEQTRAALAWLDRVEQDAAADLASVSGG